MGSSVVVLRSSRIKKTQEVNGQCTIKCRGDLCSPPASTTSSSAATSSAATTSYSIQKDKFKTMETIMLLRYVVAIKLKRMYIKDFCLPQPPPPSPEHENNRLLERFLLRADVCRCLDGSCPRRDFPYLPETSDSEVPRRGGEGGSRARGAEEGR